MSKNSSIHLELSQQKNLFNIDNQLPKLVPKSKPFQDKIIPSNYDIFKQTNDINKLFNILKLSNVTRNMICNKIKQEFYCGKEYIHISFISNSKKISNIYCNIPIYYKKPGFNKKRTIHAEENAIRNYTFKNKKKKLTIYSIRFNLNKNGRIYSRIAKPCSSCSRLINKYKDYINHIVYTVNDGIIIKKI